MFLPVDRTRNVISEKTIDRCVKAFSFHRRGVSSHVIELLSQFFSSAQEPIDTSRAELPGPCEGKHTGKKTDDSIAAGPQIHDLCNLLALDDLFPFKATGQRGSRQHDS